MLWGPQAHVQEGHEAQPLGIISQLVPRPGAELYIVGPCLDVQIHLKLHYAKRRFSSHQNASTCMKY
jgi:hypothetical protein